LKQRGRFLVGVQYCVDFASVSNNARFTFGKANGAHQ